MHLILFDVDGTLIDARGAGSRALLAALEEVFLRPFSRCGVAFAGRTDLAIVSDLIVANGLSSRQVERDIEIVFQTLPRHMAIETGKCPSIPCPGVPVLLEALERQDGVFLGLVTGNLWATAAAKLSSAGLSPSLFRFGAFGNDAIDRNALPPLALRRAANAVGQPASSAIIVGDTPADIESARVNGLLSVAVATGPSLPDELAACRPDYLFADLTDLTAVLEALIGKTVL